MTDPILMSTAVIGSVAGMVVWDSLSTWWGKRNAKRYAQELRDVEKACGKSAWEMRN